MGSTQSADGVKFKLISARQKRVFIKLQVTTQIQEIQFTGLSLVKISGSGDNSGEMNPFEGKIQLYLTLKGKSILSELVFDFKPPNNVELVCIVK